MCLYKFLLVVAIALSGYCKCQNLSEDIALIESKENFAKNEFEYYKIAGNNKNVIHLKQQTFFAKINPVNNLMKGAMLLYQNVLSPQLSKSCPYEITCSNFSKQSIEKFGVFKGLFLSADRITRCNRISLQDVHLQNINTENGAIIDAPSKYVAHE